VRDILRIVDDINIYFAGHYVRIYVHIQDFNADWLNNFGNWKHGIQEECYPMQLPLQALRVMTFERIWLLFVVPSYKLLKTRFPFVEGKLVQIQQLQVKGEYCLTARGLLFKVTELRISIFCLKVRSQTEGCDCGVYLFKFTSVVYDSVDTKGGPTRFWGPC
jgi:hypothetical protein